MADIYVHWLIYNKDEDYYYLVRSRASKYVKARLNRDEKLIGTFSKLTGDYRAIAERLKKYRVILSGDTLEPDLQRIPDETKSNPRVGLTE